MKGKSLDMQIWGRSLQKLNTEDACENLNLQTVCNRQLMRCQMSQVRQDSGFEFCTILKQTAKEKKSM